MPAKLKYMTQFLYYTSTIDYYTTKDCIFDYICSMSSCICRYLYSCVIVVGRRSGGQLEVEAVGVNYSTFSLSPMAPGLCALAVPSMGSKVHGLVGWLIGSWVG